MTAPTAADKIRAEIEKREADLPLYRREDIEQWRYIVQEVRGLKTALAIVEQETKRDV